MEWHRPNHRWHVHRHTNTGSLKLGFSEVTPITKRLRLPPPYEISHGGRWLQQIMPFTVLPQQGTRTGLNIRCKVGCGLSRVVSLGAAPISYMRVNNTKASNRTTSDPQPARIDVPKLQKYVRLPLLRRPSGPFVLPAS
jgi:hypothetical protein